MILDGFIFCSERLLEGPEGGPGSVGGGKSSAQGRPWKISQRIWGAQMGAQSEKGPVTENEPELGREGVGTGSPLGGKGGKKQGRGRDLTRHWAKGPAIICYMSNEILRLLYFCVDFCHTSNDIFRF